LTGKESHYRVESSLFGDKEPRSQSQCNWYIPVGISWNSAQTFPVNSLLIVFIAVSQKNKWRYRK